MLKKSLMELCLLHLLAEQDRYGYELLQQLHAGFPDTQESALYAVLRGLCKEGCTESYSGQVSGGPTRKYYRLTPAGTAKLDRLLADWRALTQALRDLGIDGAG